MRTPARLTRRGVVASRLAGAAAVLVIAFGVVQGLQPLAPDVVGSRTVTVVPGQTLWSIATAANPTIDPRVTVEALRRLNGLEDSSVIEPGRELSVPVFDDP